MSTAGSILSVPVVVFMPIRTDCDVGCCTVVRRGSRNAVVANYKAYIFAVVTQQIVHLLLCPCRIILSGFIFVFGANQCAELHQGIVSCAAPAVVYIILILASVYFAINVIGGIAPVASDFCIDNSSAQTGIVIHIVLLSIVGSVGVFSVFRLVGFFSGCQVHPTSCPGNIILAFCTVVVVFVCRCWLTISDCKVVQSSCIGQIFLIAKIDVILCQGSCILSCNVTGTACNSIDILSNIGSTCHAFRCTPSAVVTVNVDLVNELADSTIGIQCCGSFKEITEIIGNNFKMIGCSSFVKLILELVISPSQRGSSEAFCLTKFDVVAGIVEAARSRIACMAIVSPGECTFFSNLIAAHVCIEEIQGILQKFCIVIQSQIFC